MNKICDIVVDGVDDKDGEILPYFNFEPASNISTHIYLIKDTTQRNRIKTMILGNCNGVPSQITQVCRCLSDFLSRLINPINSYNYYYRTGDDLWCYFSYPTDDFCVHVRDSDIVVYGEIYNLCRVIKDILMVSARILPLHAAAVSMNNKGFCIVGDSKSGKSYFIFNLLKQGFRFIADDITFASGDYLINVDREIKIRQDIFYEETPFTSSSDKIRLYVKPQYVCEERFTVLNKMFSLSKEPGSIISTKCLLQPFPIIPLQSYWCCGLFEIIDFEKYIYQQVERSILYWDKLLREIVNIVPYSNVKEMTSIVLQHLK